MEVAPPLVDDILSYIFSFITYPRYWLPIKMTCKRFLTLSIPHFSPAPFHKNDITGGVIRKMIEKEKWIAVDSILKDGRICHGNSVCSLWTIYFFMFTRHAPAHLFDNLLNHPGIFLHSLSSFQGLLEKYPHDTRYRALCEKIKAKAISLGYVGDLSQLNMEEKMFI